MVGTIGVGMRVLMLTKPYNMKMGPQEVAEPGISA